MRIVSDVRDLASPFFFGTAFDAVCLVEWLLRHVAMDPCDTLKNAFSATSIVAWRLQQLTS